MVLWSSPLLVLWCFGPMVLSSLRVALHFLEHRCPTVLCPTKLRRQCKGKKSILFNSDCKPFVPCCGLHVNIMQTTGGEATCGGDSFYQTKIRTDLQNLHDTKNQEGQESTKSQTKKLAASKITTRYRTLQEETSEHHQYLLESKTQPSFFFFFVFFER